MPPTATTPRQRIDIEAVRKAALGCTLCPLHETRTQVVWGDGTLDSDVMLVGEAPGFHEDQQGRAFVGAAGQLLDKLMAEVELDRTKVAIVNVLKCRPPNNRDPRPEEIHACTPYLQSQLAYMQPKVIVTLGNFATRFILDSQIGITRARGQVFERNGSAVIPTFHPAAALRGGRFGGIAPVDAIRQDLRLVRSTLDRMTAPSPAPADASDEGSDPTEQLGLF